MLRLAAVLLGLTAVGGMGLLALYQWIRPVGWWRLPGLTHGGLGLLGLALLLASLGGAPRGVQTGTSAFGIIAAVLIGLAVLSAAVAYFARRRASTTAPLALGLHATFAVAGLAMLLAYL